MGYLFGYDFIIECVVAYEGVAHCYWLLQ